MRTFTWICFYFLLSLSSIVRAVSLEEVLTLPIPQEVDLDPTGQYLYLSLEVSEKRDGTWFTSRNQRVLDLKVMEWLPLPSDCNKLKWKKDKEQATLLMVCTEDSKKADSSVQAQSYPSQKQERLSEIQQQFGTFYLSPQGDGILYRDYYKFSSTPPFGHIQPYPDLRLTYAPLNPETSPESKRMPLPDIKGYTTSVAWSDDGQRVLVTTQVAKETIKGLSFKNFYIYEVSTHTTHPVPIAPLPLSDLNPVFSPRGTKIVYGRGDQPIMSVIQADGTLLKEIPFGEYAVWLTDEDLLISQREKDQYRWDLYSLKGNTHSKLPILTSSPFLSYSGAQSLTFITENWNTPPFVRILTFDSLDSLRSGDVQIQDIPLTERPKLPFKTETLTWTSRDNTSVEGTLIVPSQSKEGDQCPLVVLLGDKKEVGVPRHDVGRIHPELSRSPGLYADAGFCVFIPHVRGTYGYGPKFAHINGEDIAHRDVEDVLTGIQFLIDKKRIERKKVALFGKGYGGYLALMTALQAPEQICAVSASNAYTYWPFQGASYTDIIPKKWLGSVKSNMDQWVDLSPVMHAFDLHVPIRLEFTDSLDVPKAHTETLTYLLKRSGKPVEAYKLSGSHNVYSPESRARTLPNEIDFFQSACGLNSTEHAPLTPHSSTF